MSISMGMILFGALLVAAGWQNKSLSALARGDSSVAKGSSSSPPSAGLTDGRYGPHAASAAG